MNSEAIAAEMIGPTPTRGAGTIREKVTGGLLVFSIQVIKFVNLIIQGVPAIKKSKSPAPERQGTKPKWRIAAESLVVLWYKTNATVCE